MRTHRRLRVLVIGAGIGGLAVARALRLRGFEVTVLERADSLEPVGAGISLASNATRALASLGLLEGVMARGAPARSVAILDRRGHTLQELPAEVVSGAVAIHRAELQSLLATGEEHLANSVVAVDPKGVVHTAGGASQEADLVVGADGINSVARSHLFPDRVPVYAGYTAWRGVAPRAFAPGRWQESWGRGGRFGALDIGAGRTYWFATKNARAGEPDGGKPEIVDRLEGWHAPSAELVKATPEQSILRHDIYDLDPLPAWSEGRLTLLGDAAHASTPGVGQGAAQALEDSVHLAHALASTETVDEALALYEARRRPRTRTLARLARRTDRIAQASSLVGCLLRDRLTAAAPKRLQRRQYENVLRIELP